MFADEDLVIAGAIQPFDKFQVALETKRGVFAGAMEGRHENAEFHPDLLAFASRSLGARLAPGPLAACPRTLTSPYRLSPPSSPYDAGY